MPSGALSPAQEEDINCWVLGLPMQDMPVPLPDANCLPVLDQATQSAKSSVGAPSLWPPAKLPVTA